MSINMKCAFTLVAVFAVIIAENWAFSLHQSNGSKAVVGEIVEIGGRYYFISAFETSANAAVQDCNELDMKLVSIQSAEKHQAIADHLVDKTIEYYWTSGVRQSDDFFMWSGTGQSFTYTNWYTTGFEPDNTNTQPHICVLLGLASEERQWWDTVCASSCHFICEQMDQFN